MADQEYVVGYRAEIDESSFSKAQALLEKVKGVLEETSEADDELNAALSGSAVTGASISVRDYVMQQVESTLGSGSGFSGTVGDYIKDKFDGVLDDSTESIGAFQKYVNEKVSGVLENGSDSIGSVQEYSRDRISGAVSESTASFGSIREYSREKIDSLLSDNSESIKSVQEYSREKIDDVISEGSDILGSVKSLSNEKLEQAVSENSESVTSVREYAKDQIDNIHSEGAESITSVREYAKQRLSGILSDSDVGDVPTSWRELTMKNLETMEVGIATRDTATARKEMLSADDFDLTGYSTGELSDEVREKIAEILDEPIAAAREEMQKALTAEENGEDATEYVDKMVEILKEPFEKVKEVYDQLDFGDSEVSSDDSGNILNQIDDAQEGIDDLQEEAQTPISLQGDASSIISAAASAMESVKAILSEKIYLNVSTNVNVDEDEETSYSSNRYSRVKMATGGRFSSPTDIEIAEDGDAEYVIPVKKENRAVPLLRQLIGELSSSARKTLADSLGLASDVSGISASALRSLAFETSGGSSSSLKDLAGGLILSSGIQGGNTSNNNVSAPVTINVNSRNANAEQVGESIYSTAEQYLLRTMRGAFS